MASQHSIQLAHTRVVKGEQGAVIPMVLSFRATEVAMNFTINELLFQYGFMDSGQD